MAHAKTRTRLVAILYGLLVTISFIAPREVLGATEVPLGNLDLEFGNAVLLVRFEGTLYNGESDVIEGTAFFITTDGFALTAAHIIPADAAAKYRKMTLTGNLGGRGGRAVNVEVVDRDEEHDIALLRADVPPYVAVPLRLSTTPRKGDPVGVIEFQSGVEDRLVDEGILRGNEPDGRWVATVAVNPGSSGAPIFDYGGKVVAIAWGSLRVQMRVINGQPLSLPIEKTNYLIPITFASDGLISRNNIILEAIGPAVARPLTEEVRIPLQLSQLVSGNAISNVSRTFDAGAGYVIATARVDIKQAVLLSSSQVTVAPDRHAARLDFQFGCPQCPTFGVGPSPTSVSLQGDLVLERRRDPAAVIHRSYGVSETKDDHAFAASSRSFQRTFDAQPGYAISGASFKEFSKNHGSVVSVVVQPDGSSVQVTFSLESGPFYDRWRGWLDGSLITEQRKL